MSKHAIPTLASSLAFLAALLLPPASARAQAPENVLLVVNDSSQASVRIGAREIEVARGAQAVTRVAWCT